MLWLGNNHREKCKNHKLWRLNYILLNNQWITEEIKEEIKIPTDKWQWKHNDSKPMGSRKTRPKREVYTNTILPQETRKTINKIYPYTKSNYRKKKQNLNVVKGKKS